MDEKGIESVVERKRERMKHHGYAIEQDRVDDQTLLSLAQLFVEVKGMPEKKKIVSCPHGEMSACDDCIDRNKKAIGFNSAIDACTAHLVKKCEGIKEIILDTFVKEKLWNATQDLISQILAQAIKEYLVKGDNK